MKKHFGTGMAIIGEVGELGVLCGGVIIGLLRGRRSGRLMERLRYPILSPPPKVDG